MTEKIGVLLFHGLTGKPSEMRPIEKYLVRAGFEVEAPILAGHGGDQKELLATTWDQWLETAQGDLDRLSARVDRIILCGLSMGGTIASILASKNPNVAGLILLSPTFSYDGHIDPRFRPFMMVAHRWIASCVRTIPGLGHHTYFTERPPYGLRDERLQRQITKAIEAAKRGEGTEFGLFRTYYQSLTEMFCLTDELRAQAGKINIPCLMVSSLEDTLISIFNATDSYKLIAKQDKHLVMLTGCDHVLTLDLQRNYVCRIMGEFLESITGASCPTPNNSDKNGLSLELHQSLETLASSWQTLNPDRRPLRDLVPILQKQKVHERDCHTLAILNHHQPVAALAIAMVKNSSSAKPTILVGITEDNWGAPLTDDAEFNRLAWQHAERVLESMRQSYNVANIAFVDYGSNTSVSSRRILASRKAMRKFTPADAVAASRPRKSEKETCAASL